MTTVVVPCQGEIGTTTQLRRLLVKGSSQGECLPARLLTVDLLTCKVLLTHIGWYQHGTTAPLDLNCCDLNLLARSLVCVLASFAAGGDWGFHKVELGTLRRV